MYVAVFKWLLPYTSVGLLQMRNSQPVLDKILADDQAIPFLSSLLPILQPEVQLAAIKLLAALCSQDLAKNFAVRQTT